MRHVPRFFIKTNNVSNTSIRITDKDAIHKISIVLRMKPDDRINLCTNTDVYLCKLSEINKNEILTTIIESEGAKKICLKNKITLAQAIIKPIKKLEMVVSANTAIGITSFVFFSAEYSNEKKIPNNKLDRLKTIAKETCLQSERPNIPNITQVKTLDEMLKLDGFDIKILLHSRRIEHSNNLKEIISRTHKNVMLIIGPEGGFSEKELEDAVAAGAKIGYLDTFILKSELAGQMASSSILF